MKNLIAVYFSFLLFVFHILFIFSFSSCAEAKFHKQQHDYHVIISQKKNSNKTLASILQDTQIYLEQRVDRDLIDTINLNYRVEQDHLYIRKILESQGYYKAKIKSVLKKEAATIKFKVDAGEQYKFGKIQVLINKKKLDAIQPLDITSAISLKAITNAPALVSNVIKDQQLIKKWIEVNKCFFKYSVQHNAVVNNLKNQIDITYHVTVKSKATFGKINFMGNLTVAPLYLNRLVSIKEGRCFKQSEINAAKTQLQKSRLFAEVNVVLPQSPSPDGTVPITFNLKEGKYRSIKTGISYSTDISLGLDTKWEHNNFLGHGEKFSASLSLAKIKSQLGVQLVKPFFLKVNQRLKIDGTFKKESSEAYRSKGFDISGNIERDISNKKIIGIGAKYNFEQVKKQDNSKNLMLLSVPMFISQDKRDDILNPKKGWTFNINIEPSLNTLNSSTTFVKNKLSGTIYHSIPVMGKPIIAFRAATGGIIGANTTIPVTKRFYVGGGGSLRGYEYQSVGPIDKKNIPLGGRSFIEISTELRIRINNNYGMVAFIDAGNVYNSVIPNFKNGMRCGVGVGLRYYTQFGPLRADIAIPLHKRVGGIDKAYQLYFSIGQAF